MKWSITSGQIRDDQQYFKLARYAFYRTDSSHLQKGICLLSLYIILPSFIKIGLEHFEINHIKTHRHTDTQTDTQTDTYTLMKIIPVQKQSFWAR